MYDTEYPRGFEPRKDKLVDNNALRFHIDLLILSGFTYKQNLSFEIDFGKKKHCFLRSLGKISEAIYFNYLILLHRTSVM